jgi:putative phage-type endonuclease
VLKQGTDEWRQARCGSIGSSDAPRMVRKIKSGDYSADREQLLAEKLIERMTGTPFAGFKSAAMAQGVEREPLARMTYELVRGVTVEEVGLVTHPTIEGVHASPDGYVGEKGGIEIKCPLAAAHMNALLSETVAGDYLVQMHWQMACTGRAWIDFVSFHPDFPAPMQMWIKRVPRDPARIAELESAARVFIGELQGRIGRLTRRYLARAA